MSMVAEPMSISALAVITGRDRRTIAAKLNNILPVAQDGRAKLYSTPQALAAIYVGDENGEGALDHTHESARYKKAQADKTELEVSTLRGDLIPAEDVRLAWAEIVSTVRAKLLSLPSAAAVRVVGLTLREVEREMKDLVYQVLEELKESDANSEDSERREAKRDPGKRVRDVRPAAQPDN